MYNFLFPSFNIELNICGEDVLPQGEKNALAFIS